MRRLLLLALLTATAASCDMGSERRSSEDKPGGPADEAPAGSFTAFVIDLIEDCTDDREPVAYEDFASLPDPDGDANNVRAYHSLF